LLNDGHFGQNTFMSEATDFSYVDTAEPHREHTKVVLRSNPGIRQLMGRNPFTFVLIAMAVCLQLSLAILLRNASWPVLLLLALGAGTIPSHGLLILIHECAHELVWPRRWQNMATGIFANLVHVLPSSVAFQGHHLRHHSFLGGYEQDLDLPSRWEADLVGSSRLRKTFWLALCPLFQAARHFRSRESRNLDRWVLFNLSAVVAVDVVLSFFFGVKPIIYLFTSTFGFGLHPFGARFIQEHHIVNPPQETYSYYGALNLLAFNVGYHHEHHDFPSVPWNRLPALKTLGGLHYANLVCYRSWSRLAMRWIWDPSISLTSRYVRHSFDDATTGGVEGRELPGLR
jgi:sphingolipid delta-4 desaturase